MLVGLRVASRFSPTVAFLVLAACGGGGGGSAPASSNPPPQPPSATQYTVGGVVQGLAGTGLAIWGSGISKFDIATNGSFTVPATFSSGQSYQYVLYANPISPIQDCTVLNGSGTVVDSNITNIVIDCKTNPARYLNGRNWNDYVVNDGATFLQGSGAACDITQTGGYRACLHGGEIREFELTGISDCTGLSIRDQLGAFDWVCVAGSPYAKTVSRGLKPDRGLTDLIDFDQAAWRPNSVIVNSGVADVFTTTAGVWWHNTIVPLNGSNVLASLGRGNIYILTSNFTSGEPLTFGGDTFALVIKPGVKFTFTAATNAVCAISAHNRMFTWIEGEVDSARCGIDLGFRSVVSGARLEGHGALGSVEGISVWGGNDNLIRNVQITGFGIGVRNYFSQQNTFTNVDIRNAVTGFSFYQSRNHVMSGVTFDDLTTTTVFEDVSSYYNRLLDSTLASWSGPVASTTYSAASNNVVVNAQSVQHDAPSEAPFVGRVTTDDVANQGDNNAVDQLGPGMALYQNIGDWFRFDNSYRGWGGNTSAASRCVDNVACQIWDLSLKQSDTSIRNVLPVPEGNDVMVHAWNVSQYPDPAAACATVIGASWNGAVSTCTTTYLANAVEFLGDMVGNEDGFCQSNERCLYTPNISSYQGHGELVEVGPFVDGTISGVSLYRYSTNGR